MKYVKDIIISMTEPPLPNVAWLQPQNNGTYKLFIYGDNGWSPLASNETGSLSFEFVQEIPDIVTNKE